MEMTTTIKEQIMQNLKALLETITTDNEYSNDIVSVQRYDPRGNIYSELPCVVLIQGDETQEDKPFNFITATLPVIIELTIQDDGEDPIDTVLNSFLGDIQKAIGNNDTLDGLAHSILIQRSMPFDAVDNQTFVGLLIHTEIKYRFNRFNPTCGK